jgi:hypothetical protein
MTAVPGLQAQGLTNEQVLKMMQAGLPESTVILAIEADPAGLDTSPEALIKMQEGGASKAILDAMVTAKTKKAAPPATVAPAIQEMPNFNEIIAVVGDKRIKLMLATGQMRGSATPFGSAKVRQTFSGAQSPTRIPSGQVTFELFIAGNVRAEEAVSLAIPEVRRNDRRIEVARTGGFMAVSTSGGRKTLVPVKYEKIGEASIPGMSATKYRLVPEEKLAPGEYVLMLSHQFFDFGIDGN